MVLACLPFDLKGVTVERQTESIAEDRSNASTARTDRSTYILQQVLVASPSVVSYP